MPADAPLTEGERTQPVEPASSLAKMIAALRSCGEISMELFPRPETRATAVKMLTVINSALAEVEFDSGDVGPPAALCPTTAPDRPEDETQSPETSHG